MFYAARGSIPPKRHTQHRAPDGSLYAEELFGVEGFTGRSSLLYHLTPPTRTHKIEPVGRGDPARGGRRRLPPPPTDRRGRRRAARRRRQRPDPAVLQQRRRDGRRPPGRSRCPRRSSTATARPTRCSSSTRARACSTPSSGRSATAPATTSCSRSGRPGGWSRTRAAPQRMLYLECPSEIEPPKRYRNDYGQLLEHSPVLAARHPAARTRCRPGPTRASSRSTSRCATG